MTLLFCVFIVAIFLLGYIAGSIDCVINVRKVTKDQ